MKHVIGAFSLVLMLAAPTHVAAQDLNAELWVQSLADNATAILSDPENDSAEVVAAFQSLLIENTAMRNFGRSALGAYSRIITEEEFDDYVELLGQYATSIMQGQLSEYSGQRIIVVGSREDARENFAYVSVESDVFSTDGEKLAGVRWLLIRRGDQYRIYDLTMETPAEEGTFSLLQTQREEFNSVLSSNGGRIGPLLRYLRERIRESGMVPAN